PRTHSSRRSVSTTERAGGTKGPDGNHWTAEAAMAARTIPHALSTSFCSPRRARALALAHLRSARLAQHFSRCRAGFGGDFDAAEHARDFLLLLALVELANGA